MWLLPLLFVLSVLEDEKPKLAEQFQGLWTLNAANRDGKELKPEELKERFFDITKNKVLLEVQGEVKEEATYKADFSKSPVEIDITYETGKRKGKTALGILKLDGDSLIFAFSNSDETRPQGFKPIPGKKHDLFVLTRTPSRNKGKLEGTEWVNVAGEVKGNRVPAGLIHLEFTNDGKFSMVIPGSPEAGNGTYTLRSGDYVIMTFDKVTRGPRVNHQKIVIKGDNMALIDSDGTTLNFARKK